MGKRSHRGQIDIVSETQQNARWLLGRRSYTSVSDKSEAEWSSNIRHLLADNKAGKHPTFIYMIFLGVLLLVMSYFRIEETGLSAGSVFVIILTVLVWAWILRSIARWCEKE